MSEEQNYLIDLLSTAVNSVYQEERFLLRFADGDREGLEQAFVFRTGIYLSRLIVNTNYEILDLDSEYNKNHGGSKTSSRFPNGMRPDLILHRRDSNEQNKLVVEFKGFWNANNSDNDFLKLEDLTSPNENYKYLIGAYVEIGRQNPNYTYFINGQRYE